MGLEIERKYLIHPDKLGLLPTGAFIRQSYLTIESAYSVRVRIRQGHAFLTVKENSDHLSRIEFEYSIPSSDANYMLKHFCTYSLIEKTRYEIMYSNNTWEVDIFEGLNKGLMIAEIELNSENEAFERPPWLADEVTGDSRYYSTYLVKTPYKDWPIQEK